MVGRANPYIGTVPPKVVVCPQGIFHVLLAVRRCKGNSNNPPYVTGSKPSFLVVVGTVQLPSFLLWTVEKMEYRNRLTLQAKN